MSNSKGMSNICKLKYHYVYQTKNLINGKTYIGRHSTNNLNDGYMGSGKMLHRAFKKYGKNNFVCNVLSYFETYEESVEEEKWLVTCDYCANENNYNLVPGGANPIMYGENNPAWRGGVSKSINYRIKGTKHCFKGENNPRFGYKYTEEDKIKMRLSQDCKPITVNNKYYNSIKECMKDVGRSRYFVLRRLNSDKFPDWVYSKK